MSSGSFGGLVNTENVHKKKDSKYVQFNQIKIYSSEKLTN